MGNESAQARRTKKLIRETFLELFKTNSIESITIKEIAHTAGLNRSTVYHHYSSLYSILGDCIYEKAGMADRYIPSADDPNFMHILWENNVRAYKDIRDHAGLYGQLSRHRSKLSYDEDHVTILRAHSSTYYRGIVDELLKINSNIKVPRRYLENMLEKASATVVSIWIENDFRETSEEMADTTQTFFVAIINGVFE